MTHTSQYCYITHDSYFYKMKQNKETIPYDIYYMILITDEIIVQKCENEIRNY